MNDRSQLFLFDAPGVIMAVETIVHPFGNRTDVVFVNEGDVSATALLELSDGVVHVNGQGIISRSE